MATSLLFVSNFISEQFDSGRQADAIYNDFWSAFDRLDHIILLDKLSVIK